AAGHGSPPGSRARPGSSATAPSERSPSPPRAPPPPASPRRSRQGSDQFSFASPPFGGSERRDTPPYFVPPVARSTPPAFPVPDGTRPRARVHEGAHAPEAMRRTLRAAGRVIGG